MKSYGRIDSSWDKAKTRSILEDASEMAREHSMSFRIGEDADGNVVILPNQEESGIHIFVCGITTKKTDGDSETKEESEREFWDNVAYHNYTIDEMTPRAYDCLVNGIVKYGGLRFLSEGRFQLRKVLGDATKMVKKHNKPFIMGLSKEHGIMISPMSEKSKFLAPLSYVITKSGFWSVSDMHSDQSNPPESLYEGIAYGSLLHNSD